jgi:hypothetical protein
MEQIVRPLLRRNAEICKHRGTHRVDMTRIALVQLTNPPKHVRYCSDCGAEVKVKLEHVQKTYAEVPIENI